MMTPVRSVCLMFLLLFQCSGFAAFERFPFGPRDASLGGAAAALPGDVACALVNPSLLPSVSSPSLFLVHVPGMFQLAELKRTEGGMVFPFDGWAGGVRLSLFGSDFYRETILQAGIGAIIADGVAAGIGLRLQWLSIIRYGSTLAVGVDIGLHLRISDGMDYTLLLQNANAPAIGRSGDDIPPSLQTGICLRPIPELGFHVSLAKDRRFPVALRVGAEYRVVQEIYLRAGVSEEPGQVTAGAGFDGGWMQMDYAYSFHADLGPTQMISLTFLMP